MFVLVLLVITSLTACGVIGRTGAKTMQLAFKGKPDVQPTAAEVANSPYPQIKVTSPLGGAILVLGNIDDGRQAWYSSERSIVFLRNGLLVATHGGTPELRGVSIDNSAVFGNLSQVALGTKVMRRYDVMPGYHYGIAVSGTFYPGAQEQVQILDRTLVLLHVREHLQGVGWNRDNHYWVDPTSGFIWKSVQAVAADTSLEIIQLKPYQPDLQQR